MSVDRGGGGGSRCSLLASRVLWWQGLVVGEAPWGGLPLHTEWSAVVETPDSNL